MNVTETKYTLKNLPPKRSVLLRSAHGLGKSSVIRQTCAELSEETGTPFECIDIRLSQREVGDIIGYPRGVDKYTVHRKVYVKGELSTQEVIAEHVMIHDLPVWFPQDNKSHGFLLLDELDRAPRESQQAGFEIVLDYRLNLHDLPEGWRVVAAVNGDQDVYSVLDMDPALMDRFFVIDFKPTNDEWEAYATTVGIHDAVLKFIAKHPMELWTPEKPESGKVYQSPRAWEFLSQAIQHMTSKGSDPIKDLDYLLLLAKGYVGLVGSQFVEFVRKDYDTVMPTDILDGFNKKLADKIAKMQVPEITYYNKMLVDYIDKESVTLTRKQNANLFSYYQAIPKDCASGLWSYFLKRDRDRAIKWYKSDPEIAKYTMQFLGKATALAM